MFDKHKTQGGVTLMICEMDDQHLINTIKIILRKINAINLFSMSENNIDDYEMELYEYPKVNKKDAAKLTKKASLALAPYILELCLRGLPNEITIDLQKTFNRTKQFIRKHNIPLLLNDKQHDDEDSWDEIE
jgi:hypothetical protein